MKLSRKSDYALRALFCMANQRSSKPLSVREMAESNQIPRKFLESIMRELREIQLVESIAGKNGGYVLRKSPSDISLLDVIKAFDGPLIDLEPSESDTQTPDQVSTLRVRRILQHIGSELDNLMSTTTLQHVLDDRPINYLITNRDEFLMGDGI